MQQNTRLSHPPTHHLLGFATLGEGRVQTNPHTTKPPHAFKVNYLRFSVNIVTEKLKKTDQQFTMHFYMHSIRYTQSHDIHTAF